MLYTLPYKKMLFLVVTGITLAMSPYLYTQSATAEDREKTLPKDRGLVLICSEADFGGSFKVITVKEGEHTTVGCATDRDAKHHLDWHSLGNGALVFTCDYTDVGLANHEPFGKQDTIITVKCPQR